MRKKFFVKAKYYFKALFYTYCSTRSKIIFPHKYRKTKYCVSNDQILNCHIGESVVLEFEIDGKKYFFRECEIHSNFKRYVKNFIDFYFNFLFLKEEHSKDDFEKLLQCLKNKENYRMFINIASDEAIVSYREFRYGNIDVDSFGIHTGKDEEYAKRMMNFLRFARAKILSYRRNRFKFYQTLDSNNELAYKTTADIMGMKDFVPHTEYCFLEIAPKKIIFGTIMENAKGIRVYRLPKEERMQKITPIFQKNLLNLNLLDYLCVMTDHTMYNFNVTTDISGNFFGISCFDNNESNAFPSSKIYFFSGAHEESQYINKDRGINRPYLDFEIYTRVLDLKKRDLQRYLKEYLKKRNINGIWQRILILKNAISEETKKSKKFILSEDEWSNDTINEELSGKYGKTYLVAITN